ncbi:S-layer homology domain-containing protein [Paenibacillus luteus]|uniref:S-layer homology domain-containing protein n=1 Tax=Paenibacillus luteus TaxID=2545753 RepID=UPI001F4F5473|nr:S-layer homology domain-containing protein [Paenibacillus luteus]
MRTLRITGEAALAFTDVSSDKWYAEEVALAHQAGIVSGVSAAAFAPNAAITRQEMAAMLVRGYEYALSKKLNAPIGSVSFVDTASAPEWAQAAIAKAADLGLITGRSKEQLAPGDNGSRAESAQMILNLLHLISE